jgi:hypothetical protein
MAPDGVVGPYREREGSFYTVKQIWSPIIVEPSKVGAQAYTVTNRYAFLNADQCTYQWETIAFRRPAETESGSVVLSSRVDHGRSLPPGQSATWDGWGPSTADSHRAGVTPPDATRLIIKDSTGRIIQTYVWPYASLEPRLAAMKDAAADAQPMATESGETLTATVGSLTLRFSKTTGLLLSAARQGNSYSLTNGPRVLAMGPRPAPARRQGPQTPPAPPAPPPPPPVMAPPSRLISLTHQADGSDLVIRATFAGPMKTVTYHLKSNGWLAIDYTYSVSGAQEYFGIGFDYPETDVKGMRYLGQGPTPVYQNRLAGGTLDVWRRAYNNTMVGDPDDLKPGEHFDYPVFKGYYSGVRWLQLETSQGAITAQIDQRPGAPIYVQVFTPKTPPANQVGQAYAPFPESGLSFLHAIPAIGTKFVGPLTMGPSGQTALGQGDYSGQVSLYFGKLP